MEQHQLQAREVESTSFLQELGDSGQCSYYTTGQPVQADVQYIERVEQSPTSGADPFLHSVPPPVSPNYSSKVQCAPPAYGSGHQCSWGPGTQRLPFATYPTQIQGQQPNYLYPAGDPQTYALQPSPYRAPQPRPYLQPTAQVYGDPVLSRPQGSYQNTSAPTNFRKDLTFDPRERLPSTNIVSSVRTGFPGTHASEQTGFLSQTAIPANVNNTSWPASGAGYSSENISSYQSQCLEGGTRVGQPSGVPVPSLPERTHGTFSSPMNTNFQSQNDSVSSVRYANNQESSLFPPAISSESCLTSQCTAASSVPPSASLEPFRNSTTGYRCDERPETNSSGMTVNSVCESHTIPPSLTPNAHLDRGDPDKLEKGPCEAPSTTRISVQNEVPTWIPPGIPDTSKSLCDANTKCVKVDDSLRPSCSAPEGPCSRLIPCEAGGRDSSGLSVKSGNGFVPNSYGEHSRVRGAPSDQLRRAEFPRQSQELIPPHNSVMSNNVLTSAKPPACFAYGYSAAGGAAYTGLRPSVSTGLSSSSTYTCSFTRASITSAPGEQTQLSTSQTSVSSGRSTIHYRQVPGLQPVPFAKTVGQAASVISPSVTTAASTSVSSPYTCYSQSVSAPAYAIYPKEVPPNGQMSTYQQYQVQSSSVEFSDQHLQPIMPPPNAPGCRPNLISANSQLGLEVGKCNGVGATELPMSYPPILPKGTNTPSPVKDMPSRSPRKRPAMDKQTRNERRRQQRLRKKQEEASPKDSGQNEPSIGDELSNANEESLELTRVRRTEGRRRKATQATDEETIGEEIIEKASESPNASESQKPLSKNKKRKNSTRGAESKRLKKNESSASLQDSEKTTELDSSVTSQDMTKEESPSTEPSTEPPPTAEPVKHKVIRSRPRPKKKRPLPTLIRKKKRCSFYGDDSDSDTDISSRFGGRGVDSKNQSTSDLPNMDGTRRSERTAGDRKRYTVDLELDLSNDESDTPGDGDLATLSKKGSANVVEENEVKVVESVLGRRVTKRIVKKPLKTMDTTKDGRGANSNEEPQEEEQEEDVEEFYLKYKGYSHLHCEWRALDEIDDPRIRPKLRRFEMKQSNSLRTEDDDVVLFNPDYVEVERVLDMKVYRNGELLSAETLRQEAERDAIVDPVELKKQIKRERERKRARAIREAKARAKAEAEAALAAAKDQALVDECSSNTDAAAESEGSTTRDLPEKSVDSECDNKSTSPTSQADEKAMTLVDSEKPPLVPSPRNTSTSDTFMNAEPCSAASDVQLSSQEASDSASSPVKKGLKSIASDSNVCLSDRDSDDGSEQNDGERTPTDVTYYLVKWRSLPYEDATWELAQDVDPAKVKEFLRLRQPPKIPPVPRDNDYKIIRPDPSTWKPLESNVVYKNGNKLRDYQLEGVNWLTYCWYHHRNCILADEMGLGKTVQSVAFLLEIEKAGIRGPFLIIVPLSTVTNWQREFESWSNFNVVVYHGSSTSRNMIQEYEIFYKRCSSDTAVRYDLYKFDALVTTFEILMTDIEFFGQIPWTAAIIDEAHRLKNKKCKLGEGLRYLDLDHRVLLTGTPLQNSVEELFGLLNFLEPEKFSCATTFVAEYGDLKTEEQVENLKALLKPMMLRRLKEDVEKSLAPKEETIIEVELTNIQKKYYRAIMERNFAFLCKGSTSTNAPNLMNVMMELRKCCNHPFLIKGAEETILEEMRGQQTPGDPCSPDDSQTFQALVYASGKLVLIHKLLPKLRASGHKVLIFSQMIRVLDIIEDYLVHQRFQFERIDGRIHGPLRQEAIDRFTADPDKFVFLLCTKAGGLGINLTAADVVIIYDSDWNPQNDLQAQARCHRIGQQKMVKVYRLITRNTYEREMFDRASLKLGLDRAVLQSMGSKEARQAQMSKKEIEELLKRGAYGALMDDDKAGEDFCEEDIDQILQSRAKVVQLEQGEKNSTFSKATFSISNNRSDIELDDPNFWQKWAKKAGVDENAAALKDLIVKSPRQRRQTTRYSALMPGQTEAVSPPSYDASELDEDGSAGSSGEDNVTSHGKGHFRRSRRHRRHGRNSHLSAAGPPATPRESGDKTVIDLGGMEPLDRADLFRVERCLLTWAWGHWDIGLATVPFKRALSPSELSYFGSAVLVYALSCAPPNIDARVRATIVELTRPGVWRLSLPEIAKAVSQATTKASILMHTANTEPNAGTCASDSTTDQPEPMVKLDLPSSSSLGPAAEHSSTEAATAPALPVQELTDLPPKTTETPDDESHINLLAEDSQPKSPTPSECTSPSESITKEDGKSDEKPESGEVIASENMDADSDADQACISIEKAGPKTLDDNTESQKTPECTRSKDTKISPKSASFNPDILVPYDSFRKHVQRGCARLLNRVAFLFFLECEVVGLEQAVEFIAGRLSHTDFSDLAASLPPMEAIDSELPASWWDSCCDKCLLLGVLKHGWEKYISMRLDPDLCFRSRALANLPKHEPELEEPVSKCKSVSESPVLDDIKCDTEQKKTGDDGSANVGRKESSQADAVKTGMLSESTLRIDEDTAEATSPKEQLEESDNKTLLDDTHADAVLAALPFPAVADLNSRTRKLVGFFLRVKNQLEFDNYKRHTTEDEDDQAVQPQLVRPFAQKFIKWTRREEADFYRVVSSFGVEFTPVESPESKADVKVPKPVSRRYDWTSFRQLANLSRKSDSALTQYFQAFYRMCQQVCKKPLTEFAGPASTAATTTTSGSSEAGEDVPIDPISEERANRCLSRIDLLARIRNVVLPHPCLNERLQLCQRSSEIPSWWIPGKHDGELLRGAAKHGLARTDLNILSDPEFSFSRVINLIRQRLSRESAVTDHPIDECQTNRSNIAAAAVAAARAAVADLVKEEIMDDAGPKTESIAPSADADTKVDVKEKLEDVEDPTTIKSESSPHECYKEVSESELKAAKHEQGQHEITEAPSSKSEDNPKSPFVPASGTAGSPVHDVTNLNAVGSVEGSLSSLIKSDERCKTGTNEGTASDWSMKFATNLATAWPKDRTIQHRLEMVCHAVEMNEWPMLRRYVPTPSGASVPVTDPNRALNEARILNLSSTYSALRHPSLMTAAFPNSSSLSGKLPGGIGFIQSLAKHQGNALNTFTPESPRQLTEFRSFIRSPVEQLDHENPDLSETQATPSSMDSDVAEPSSPLNLASSSARSYQQGHSNLPSTLYSNVSPPTTNTGEYTKLRSGMAFASEGTPASPVSAPSPGRGRGRGRGRGGRGRLSSRLVSGPRDRPTTRNTSPQSPSSSCDSPGLMEKTESSKHGEYMTDSPDFSSPDRTTRSMPPPKAGSAPRSTPSGRGRKRKNEHIRNSEFGSNVSKAQPHSKRERMNPDSPDMSGKSTASVRSANSTADVWEVRVPVISLVDGSLIYGDKAPKRRALEAWLEANPNYMPYSVEVEDRTIYSRVASARGQDISNMEALAYKHYLNSLLASAAAGLNPQTSTASGPLVAGPSATNQIKAAGLALQQQQQQYLQLQQQQLLAAFGAYARHPAYSNLIASALSTWQAASLSNLAAQSLSASNISESTTSNADSLVAGSTSSQSAEAHQNPDVPSQSACPAEPSPPPADKQVGSDNTNTPSKSTTPATSSASRPCSKSSEPTSYVSEPPKQASSVVSTGSSQTMDAVLSAAYKQASVNLAYMYNPLAAAAAYSQLMLASAGNTILSDNPGGSATLASMPNQQAALASLYANYMLSAKPQQPAPQPNVWDQQRQQQQQLASLAAAIAAACGGGASGLDSSNLISMFSGLCNNKTTGSSLSICSDPSSSQQLKTDTLASTSLSSVHSPRSAGPVNLSERGDEDQSAAKAPEANDNNGAVSETTDSNNVDQSQNILDLSK
ncbi:unnamed protein product [Calicophoron daubneyi]|uniref:Chromodomain-helicase-DNA-binding protein 7 n=1 Tax=Calicophoron daubneyi TaxID=300641 RepID=A0AAV2TW08_CALDB